MESGGAWLPSLPWKTQANLLSSEVSSAAGLQSLIPRGPPWSWGQGGGGCLWGRGAPRKKQNLISPPWVEMTPVGQRRP